MIPVRAAAVVGLLGGAAGAVDAPVGGAAPSQAVDRAPAGSEPAFRCDPALTALFTPPRPQLGSYDVCTTPRPIDEVADSRWPVEQVPPLDAFGSAGTYNRSALARLFGGRRATVARGWTTRDGRFESVTLISPHPDATLTTLQPGTLRIRLIICCL
jgi:hypothetical protein